MKNKILFLLLVSALKFSTAKCQQDTVVQKSSKDLILEIDDLISTTRDELAKDDSKGPNKLKPEIKKLNKENCKRLSNLAPALKKKLLIEYSKIEDVEYQIDPLIVSLKICINALESLTSHETIYEEGDKKDYENAFLFKELAKGNLFRALNSSKDKPSLFSFSMGFGFHGNPMYKTFTDTYTNTAWRNENGTSVDFRNEKASANLFYVLSFDCNISNKLKAGIRFQSLPSANIQVQIPLSDTIYPFDYATETFSGNAFNMHIAYVIKKTKLPEHGLEVAVGAGLQLNNFTLEREINTIRKEFTYISFSRPSGSLGSPPPDTIANIFLFNEVLRKKITSKSISIGVNISADYYISKYLSLNSTLEQYLDTGVDVDQLIFYTRSLPGYQLKLSAFTFRLGMGLHF